MIKERFSIDDKIQTMIPTLIEVFVSFYGESERNKITEKFNSCEFIGYINYNMYDKLVSDAKTECSIEAEDMFLKGIGREASAEERERFFNRFHSEITSSSLAFFYGNVNKAEDYNKSSVLSYLRDFSGNDELEEGSDEYNKLVEQLLSYKSEYDKACEYYQSILNERYSDNIEYNKQLKSKLDALSKDETRKYIRELYPFLSDRDKETIDKDIEHYIPYFRLKDSNLFISGSFTLDFPCPMDYFTSESNEMLASNQVEQYEKDNIIRHRIEYFKSIGIDHGDDYQAYIDDLECRSKMPSSKLCDTTCAIRKKHKDALEIRKFDALDHMKNIVERKNRIERLNKDDGYYAVLNKNSTCLCPNYKCVDGEYSISPIIFIPATYDEDTFDAKLIHECNHLYEMIGKNITDNGATFVCGWDEDKEVFNGNINIDEGETRPYEMLSEIINEYIAQDIVTQMHDSGIYFIGSDGISKNTSKSGYEEKLRLFTRNFYDSFRDLILESRKNSDITLLYQALGKDNVLKYNKLLYDISKRYAGMKIYVPLEARMKGLDNEDTREFNGYIEEANALVDKMKAYQEQYGKNANI